MFRVEPRSAGSDAAESGLTPDSTDGELLHGVDQRSAACSSDVARGRSQNRLAAAGPSRNPSGSSGSMLNHVAGGS